MAVFPVSTISLNIQQPAENSFAFGSPRNYFAVIETVSITSVLQHYWETHSDATPSAFQARRAGSLLLEWLNDVRKKPAASAQDFSLPWQQDFVKWLGQEKNHTVATIAREMTSIAAAFNHGLKRGIVVDETGERRETQLLKYSVPVLYKVGEISRLTAKPEPMPRDWLPTWEQWPYSSTALARKPRPAPGTKTARTCFAMSSAP